ncbi:MAG: AraC family transcriptional regulator [Bacteroides sp.]|nr:AraC family transcriptional regulator [Bacteroides sp.]
MDYLFLRRNRRTTTSERQKRLLFNAAERQWKQDFAGREIVGRKIDCDIYKCILYHLEIKQVFLDSELSLKKFSAMIDTNQTYLSNVVNKYFGCNLKELLNTYRVEYAKELLRANRSTLEAVPRQCGFASKSAFYAAFSKIVGVPPSRYLSFEQKYNASESMNYV